MSLTEKINKLADDSETYTGAFVFFIVALGILALASYMVFQPYTEQPVFMTPIYVNPEMIPMLNEKAVKAVISDV